MMPQAPGAPRSGGLPPGMGPCFGMGSPLCARVASRLFPLCEACNERLCRLGSAPPAGGFVSFVRRGEGFIFERTATEVLSSVAIPRG